MFDLIYNFLDNYMNVKTAKTLSFIIIPIIIAVICFIANFITKFIVVKIIAKTTKKSKTNWDDILLEKRFFHRVSHLIIPITLSLFSGSIPGISSYWYKAINVLTIILIVFVFDSAINATDAIYRNYEISKIKPIRGLLQIVKVAIFIIGGITLVAVLIGENPLALLGGIGALTAVTSLIFKDAILGFVAGIQLTANDMVRIGDWIEMSKYSADGTVIDLSLTTVKVKNFDNTITAIPAYAMVTDSFINWRGMRSSGGRRIKRSIYVDAGDVKFCDEDMLERLSKIFLLKDYIKNKQVEISEYNEKYKFDLEMPVNGRRMTNIGLFRAYITEYLKQHPKIHKSMILMVRQLSHTTTGIPIEIYCFTNTVEWEQYETIQSDIFDHLYAVAPQFELTVFQQISGGDIRKVLEKK